MSSRGHTDWDPARLAAAAATLDERLTGLYEPVQADDNTESLYSRWRYVLRTKSGDLLEKRLRWDGHDGRSVPHILGPVTAVPGTQVPKWLSRLTDSYEHLPAARQAYRNAFDNTPFQALCMPFVLSFADDIHKSTIERTAGCNRISDIALKMLESTLLQRLTAIGNAVLTEEWKLYSNETPDSVERLDLPSNPRYQPFIDRMLAGELAMIWMKYPVLARILSTVTENHVQACTEFVQRLLADWEALGSSFNQGKDLGRVDSIRAGLSDHHLGGRSVTEIDFSSGRRIIYKPRSLGLERAFQSLLEWVNRRTPSRPAFRTLTILDRGAYGWMEHVNASPCSSENETQRFFQRIGRLLCLFHGLAGTDLHHENIISAGENPVPVDLETLFQPDAAGVNGPTTVQRTDFLPRKLTGPAGNNRIVSGLGQWDERTAPRLNPSCIELIVTGFDEMYKFLIDARQDLLAEGGPLSAFRGLNGRFIFRATYVYAHVLSESLQPDHLRNGAAWSIELEFLLRKALLRSDDAPPWWVLLKSEVAALQRLDIPRFTTQVDGTCVMADSGPRVNGYLAGSGLDRARAVLFAMNEHDLEQNRQAIRTAFADVS
jgi:lantibiotic modifying enzyme